MMYARCRHLPILIVFGLLTSLPLAHGRSDEAAKALQAEAQADAASSETFPQVVRVNYVEGDVRISRGKVSQRASQADWEVAVAGVPVEAGYYLATGDGRAEIEFEDASTVYLAENSVLVFNDLHSTGGKPFTNIGLLTGTATLHVNKSDSESFAVNMPANRMFAGYHRDSYLRITSFTDGFALAPRDNTVIRMPDSALPEPQSAGGKTIYFRGNTRIPAPEPSDSPAMEGWDKWVDERVAARTDAMNAVMKEAGLTSPLPGLADLKGQGTFFKCEPYGTCWEPAAAPAQPKSDAEVQATDVAQTSAPKRMKKQKEPSLQSWYSSAPPPGRTQAASLDPYFNFPCGRIIAWSPSDPGNRKGLPSALSSQLYPIWQYDWALCHAGTWIYRNRGYVWVAPPQNAMRRIHYRPPVHWVKVGNTTAFVPLHPRDVRGKMPLNSEHGLIAPDLKSHSVRPIDFRSPGGGVKLLNSAPKGFSRQAYAPLSKATEPRTEVHPIGRIATSTLARAPAPGLGEVRGSLAFDHRSQTFLLARPVMQGGKSTTVLQPFAGLNGDLQMHVAGVDTHGNYSMRVSASGIASTGGQGGVGASSVGNTGSGGSSIGGGGFSGGAGSGGSSFPSASGGPAPSPPSAGNHN